jgi:hypothetical protein
MSCFLSLSSFSIHKIAPQERNKTAIAVRTLGQLVDACLWFSCLSFSAISSTPPSLSLGTLDLLSKGDVRVRGIPWQTLRTEILGTVGLIGALAPRKCDHIAGSVGPLAAMQTPPHQDSNEISIAKICRQDKTLGNSLSGEGRISS